MRATIRTMTAAAARTNARLTRGYCLGVTIAPPPSHRLPSLIPRYSSNAGVGQPPATAKYGTTIGHPQSTSLDALQRLPRLVRHEQGGSRLDEHAAGANRSGFAQELTVDDQHDTSRARVRQSSEPLAKRQP